MKLTTGYPFWLIKNGLPYQYPKLLQHLHQRVAIIGGGITGALMAYYLTENDIDCVLIDARTIGLGSTSASTSLIQYELDKPLHQLKEQVGAQKANKAYQLCGESIDTLADIMQQINFTDYEQNQSLFFSTHASQKDFLQQELKARAAAGFDVTLLSADDIRHAYGLKAQGGILSEKGLTLNAYHLAHELLQYSIKKGLKVYDRTCAKKIDYTKNNAVITTTEGYTINAQHIVNATGFEVNDFIDKDIVSFYYTYAIISENAAEQEALWKDRIMLWNTDAPYLYLRLTTDNRIIIGGRDERFTKRSLQADHLETKALLLEKDFARLFPGINFHREFAWGGTFGKTKDALPYIGPYPSTPLTYYALGFGGNGITFSVIAAEIITDLLLHRKNSAASLFSFKR